MMWGYGYGTWWMWLLGLLLGLMLLAGVAVAIVLTVRAANGTRPSDSAAETDADPARRVLEGRLARGEITAAEFRDLLNTLISSRQAR